ncbi:unnamed protein product, partial [Porites evermanni]
MCSISASNASNSSFAFTPEPEALRITRTVLFSLIAALALVGNYVVCRAVWRHNGTKPIAHYLVSNLAFAEIINMVCIVFMFHAYERPWSWELGSAMCKILPSLQVTSSLAITASLAILAVYRCALLIKPAITKSTRGNVCLAILLSWMGSIGLSFPSGHFRVLTSWGDNCELRFCTEQFPQGLEHYQHIYSVVLFVINFALPLVIMIISYALVDKKIREHIFVIERLNDEQERASSSVTQNSVCIQELQSGQRGLINQRGDKNEEDTQLEYKGKKKSQVFQDTNRRKNKLNKYPDAFELENDLLKMIYALVLVFVICYIPYQPLKSEQIGPVFQVFNPCPSSPSVATVDR